MGGMGFGYRGVGVVCFFVDAGNEARRSVIRGWTGVREKVDSSGGVEDVSG